MSILPPEVHSALSLLLQGLQSTDNNVRAQAEEQLNNEWIVARPDVLLMGLVEQIQGAPEAGVRIKLSPAAIRDSLSLRQSRSFAAVLFRRVATKTRKAPGSEETKDLFTTLSQPHKDAIRQKLLECLQNETLPHVRHKIGDAVAELARQYGDEGQWTTRRSLSRWLTCIGSRTKLARVTASPVRCEPVPRCRTA